MSHPDRWIRSILLAALLLTPAAAFAQAFQPVQVVPPSPCSTGDARLLFTICTCNARFLSAVRLDEVDARADVAINPLVQCVQCQPDTIGVDFGRLTLGHHKLGGIFVYHVVAGPDSGTTYSSSFAVEFDVRGNCGEPPALIPYLTDISVGARCDNCPQEPCPGDSILVRLKGMFTDPCTVVSQLSVHPSPVASPMPAADVVRLVYAHDGCAPCPAVLTPWRDAVAIGPLPAGDYRLPIEAYMIERCGTGDSLVFLGRTSYPFKVLGTCPAPDSACSLAAFHHDPEAACDAVVGPGRPGVATLAFDGTPNVGGVQGRLVFDTPGLNVIGIEPALSGTILKWEPDSTGASFVAVLPPNRPRLAGPLPLLVVRVALAPGATIDRLVRLVPQNLLVSNVDGGLVPECDISRLRLADPAARFCPEKGCDVNGDHHADVRDLVLMVNCLRGIADHCPVPDCNEDGQQNMDDVLCCARVILGGSPPDSAGSVPAPEVSVQFGAPVAVAGGVDVPVLLTAKSQIGAARLTFNYPDAAFSAASIELAQPASNWLVLHEGGGGALRLGAIRVAPEAEVGTPLLLTLHLESRAGQTCAGALSYVSGDFADPSGATLVTSAAPVAMPLGGGAQLALSAAHPNPFGRETRFTIGLAQAGELDVSIYDLRGRRVATLWKGAAQAGTRELVWDRTRDDGTPVPSGVYFYRATGNGQSQGGKVLVLGN